MTLNASSIKRWATLLDLPTELHKMIVKARRGEPPSIWADLFFRVDEYVNGQPGEWRSDIRSLSTVAKALTNVCQAELFQELRIGRQENRWNSDSDLVPSRRSKFDGPLITFCKFLKTAPHLSQHVRTLHLVITEDCLQWDSAIKGMVKATLSRMKMVTALHLVGDPFFPGRGPLVFQKRYEEFPEGLMASLLSIVGNPGFHHLFLDLVEMPAYSLAKSKHLQTLELHDASCFLWDPERNPPEPLEEPIYLNHLNSASNNINLSKLAKLEAYLDPEELAPITQQLPALEILRFTVDSRPPEYVAEIGPLSFLNPLSFTTLKELEVDTAFELFWEDDIAQAIIVDPYQGLTRAKILVQLTSLQCLKVSVSISSPADELEFNTQETFGEEWGTLQTVLLPVGREPPLRSLDEVHLTLICIDDKFNPSMTIVEEFQRRVLLSQLCRLRECEELLFFCNVKRTFSLHNPWGYSNLEPYDFETFPLF